MPGQVEPDTADAHRRVSYRPGWRPALRILEPVEGCEATFLF